MRKRLVLGPGIVLLAVLASLIIWQGSFTFGEYGPTSMPQTYVYWAVSTLVFLLTVTLGFMLFRTVLKLYIERRSNREGSRIKTKLVFGAVALSITPVIFLVLFGVSVLNFNMVTWFSRPAKNIRWNLVEVGNALDREVESRARFQAQWLAGLPETQAALHGGPLAAGFFAKLCEANNIERAWVARADSSVENLCAAAKPAGYGKTVPAHAQAAGGGVVHVLARLPVDLAEKQREIQSDIAEYDQHFENRRHIRNFYLLLLFLIALFVLFVATWIAHFLARQMSDPIAALLEAAGEVRRGNLAHRIRSNAIDEMATLVRAFNEMTRDLDANSRELERRRRFTEAILENIPTGVLSLSADGRILRHNPALARILPPEQIARAARLDDLFSREDAAEIRYLMKRARRTGVASRQLDLAAERQTLHLSVTVSAFEEKVNTGFVVVIEDTSELLRAQRAAAWHEVARRVAHEIKNPLTPIALCAERMARHLDRPAHSPESARVMRECVSTISHEVESVKTLVDEFSSLARFPAAQLAPASLNDVVENALAVFQGRLDGIEIHKSLAPNLPPVQLDREQFKRAVVNLVDNAAESMQDALVKRLFLTTQAGTPEAVELVIADTGCGVSPEDREKLFLPYFSTKQRGTGLGLAIVHHILADHRAQIRVEDNQPVGARFIVELPVASPAEPDRQPAEAQA